MQKHYRGDYASLTGDGVTLDLHVCDVCHQKWPCDASVLQGEIEQLQTYLQFEEHHSNDLMVNIEDYRLVLRNCKTALMNLQKAVKSEHDTQSSTSAYINWQPPEHARSYMRCDHPLCLAGKQHDPNFRPDRIGLQ